MGVGYCNKLVKGDMRNEQGEKLQFFVKNSKIMKLVTTLSINLN